MNLKFRHAPSVLALGGRNIALCCILLLARIVQDLHREWYFEL